MISLDIDLSLSH